MSDAVVNGLAGAGGGIIAQLLTYPLQAVNTRQQTQRRAKQVTDVSLDEATLVARQEESKQANRGTAQEMWDILQGEGVGGLYRGLSPSLVGTTCSQGVYYYFYALFRDQAEALARRSAQEGKGSGSVTMLGSLLVASLAGCANVLLTNPIWVIVTRMQTQSQVQTLPRVPGDCKGSAAAQAGGGDRGEGAEGGGERRPVGALSVMRDLYAEAGILGFWKGVFPTLVMVTNPALQFMIYEALLAKLTAKRPPGKGGLKAVTAGETFCMGAVAKLGATVATYPLLVVKSRLQARQDIGAHHSLRYTGTLDAILKMLRHEGVSGFYRGMSTKIVQSVFAAAVLFMTKEELVKLARALVERKQRGRPFLARKKV